MRKVARGGAAGPREYTVHCHGQLLLPLSSHSSLVPIDMLPPSRSTSLNRVSHLWGRTLMFTRTPPLEVVDHLTYSVVLRLIPPASQRLRLSLWTPSLESSTSALSSVIVPLKFSSNPPRSKSQSSRIFLT